MMEVVEDEVKELNKMQERTVLQLGGMIMVTCISLGGLIIDGDTGIAMALGASGLVGGMVGWLFPSPIVKKE